MKVSDEIGMKLLAALDKVSLGGYIEFHSPLPGLSEEFAVCKLVSKSDSRWGFEFYWFDVLIGTGYATLTGDTLTFGVDP